MVDHPGMSLVSHALDGKNYNSWKVAMTIALEFKNKWRLIDGSFYLSLLNLIRSIRYGTVAIVWLNLGS